MLYTKNQLHKRHMTIKDDAIGIKRYSTIYYSENEIRKMTEGEIHAYKELNAKKRREYLERKET